jgi:hypothetical protein
MVWRHHWPAGSPFDWSSNERKTNSLMRRIKPNARKVELFRWRLHGGAHLALSQSRQLDKKAGRRPIQSRFVLGSVQFYTDAATARAQSHTCRTLPLETAIFIKSAVAGFAACDRSRVGGDMKLAKHFAAP